MFRCYFHRWHTSCYMCCFLYSQTVPPLVVTYWKLKALQKTAGSPRECISSTTTRVTMMSPLSLSVSVCLSVSLSLLKLNSNLEYRSFKRTCNNVKSRTWVFVSGAWGSWWTGGNDVAKEGKYKWGTSGRDIVYTNWVSPEPNGGTNENCITVDYRGDWATVRCGRYFLYVCEVWRRHIFKRAGWMAVVIL